jgi:DNA-binding GntR family transcriptional regulator
MRISRPVAMQARIGSQIAQNDPPLTIERPPKTLRSLVQVALREAILDMRFQPGERLIERMLCEQLGVSRTVVREVLRYLEAEGLVEISENKGPMIATIKPEEAGQIYELRAVLESMAAAECARVVAPAEVGALAEALEQIREGHAEKDARKALRATTRFYEQMFRTARKTIAWSLLEPLMVRINALRAMTISSEERLKASMSEMEQLFRAIAARDPARAHASAFDHVKEAEKAANRILAYGAGTHGETLDIMVRVDEPLRSKPKATRRTTVKGQS